MQDAGAPARPKSGAVLAGLGLAGILAFAGLMALGIWQVQRLSWKRQLIARVEARLAATPTPAPPPADWPTLYPGDAYRRIRLTGTFDSSRETCTQAVTELGAGCWVMTPLQTRDGWWVLVNQGFVDLAHRDPGMHRTGASTSPVTIEGLLRVTEPGGGFLRHNDPAAGHWYSRDVAAITAARGLPAGETAPYFVDASETVPGGPVGGLTVVRFANNHLAYALTWFSLAGLVLFGGVQVARNERRLRTGVR